MSPLKTERDGGVLLVTLDRPKANAIDLKTSVEMGEVFRDRFVFLGEQFLLRLQRSLHFCLEFLVLRLTALAQILQFSVCCLL